MGKARYGAQKRADFFGIKPDHTGLVKADGTTVAAALADAILTIGNDDGEYIIESMDFTPKADGSRDFKIVTTQYNTAINEFKKEYFPPTASASGAKPQKFSVTGYSIGGGTSSNKNCYMVIYGGCDGTDVVVNTHVVAFANTSLAKSYKGQNWLTVTLEGSTIAALADITIDDALFDSTLVTVTTAQTHEKGYHEAEFFLPKGSSAVY